MFYAIWVIGMIVSVYLTVYSIKRLENAGYFDKYENKK